VKDTGEEQTSPAASAQPFAYIITGSTSSRQTGSVSPRESRTT
jgi:hypothetical protein